MIQLATSSACARSLRGLLEIIGERHFAGEHAGVVIG